MQCESGHIFEPNSLDYGYKCNCGKQVVGFIQGKTNSLTCESGHNIDSMKYGYKCRDCGDYIIDT